MEVPALLPQLGHLAQVGIFLPVEGCLTDILLHFSDFQFKLPVFLFQRIKLGKIICPIPKGAGHSGRH